MGRQLVEVLGALGQRRSPADEESISQSCTIWSSARLAPDSARADDLLENRGLCRDQETEATHVHVEAAAGRLSSEHVSVEFDGGCHHGPFSEIG